MSNFRVSDLEIEVFGLRIATSPYSLKAELLSDNENKVIITPVNRVHATTEEFKKLMEVCFDIAVRNSKVIIDNNKKTVTLVCTNPETNSDERFVMSYEDFSARA